MRLGAALPVLCRWDLDKTYLRTNSDTLPQLWRTAWERGVDKVEVPGVPEVLKALRAAAERRRRPLGVYFISASPPQIGKAVRDKLAYDGVPYDDIVFKDQLQHIRRGKFWNLREHVGFKLRELMKGRLASDEAAPVELLFGDDWESDPLTYSAYADIVAGRLRGDPLSRLLTRIGVDRRVVPELRAMAEQVEPSPECIVRIFINLARRTPPAKLHPFGRRLVPTFNYFQTAVALAADRLVDPDGVAAVARALVERADYTPQRLQNSLDDLVRRGGVGAASARRTARPLRQAGLLPPHDPADGWRHRFDRWWRSRHRAAAPEPGAIDYDLILTRLAQLPASIEEGRIP